MAGKTYPTPVWDGEAGAQAPSTIMNRPMGVESNNKTTSKTTSKKKNTGSGTGSSAGSQSSAAASDGYAIYVAYLQECGRAPSTIKTDLAAIRFFHDLMQTPRHQLPGNGELLLQRRTFGGVTQGIEDMIPLPWNKKVKVEHYG